MRDRVKENVIEWIENDKFALCTFSQKKFVNRVYKLINKGVPGVEILNKNEDGSILARVPLKHIYLSNLSRNTAPQTGVEG